ncbi:MAG: hypothetical protein WDO19_02950 [Bacteroidota bacterium]
MDPCKQEYFVKGSDNLAIAKRKAQTGNWTGLVIYGKQKRIAAAEK